MDILLPLGVFAALFLLAAGLGIGLVWLCRVVVGQWINPQLEFAVRLVERLARASRSKTAPMTPAQERDATILSAVILAGRSAVIVALLFSVVATARLAYDVYRDIATEPPAAAPAIVLDP